MCYCIICRSISTQYNHSNHSYPHLPVGICLLVILWLPVITRTCCNRLSWHTCERIFSEIEKASYLSGLYYTVLKKTHDHSVPCCDFDIQFHAQLWFELPDFFYADSLFTPWAWIRFLFQCIENIIWKIMDPCLNTLSLIIFSNSCEMGDTHTI